MKGFRSAGANILTNSAHFLETRFKLGTRLNLNKLADFRDMAVDKAYHSQNALFLGVVEIVAPRIQSAVLLYLLEKSPEPELEADSPIAREVRVSVYARRDVVFRCDSLRSSYGKRFSSQRFDHSSVELDIKSRSRLFFFIQSGI